MNTLRRLQAVYAEHRAFAYLLSLFIVFRLLAALFLQPGGFLIPWSPDQLFYHAVGTMSGSGLFPYLDYWMEFPPVFPWLVVASYRLSLFIPSANNIFWFNAILRILMVPFDVGSLVLIYASVSRLRSNESALAASTAFGLLFAPLFAFLGWFDSVVLFFILLSLYGLTVDSPILTGLGIGLGFGVKLFPLAVLPSAVQVFRTMRRMIALLGTSAASVAAIFMPFFILSSAYTIAFFRTLSGRTSWETVWALAEGYTGWGAVAPLSIRDDPTTTAWVPDGYAAGSLPWLWITLIFALIGLFLWTRRIDWTNPVRSTAFAGVTFCIMLLYGKGYSPQWGVYLSTLAVVLLPGGRGIWYGLLFSVLTGLEWPFAFQVFPETPAFLASIIIVRTAVTLLLCIELSAVAFEGAAWLRYLARPLPAITAGTLTILTLASVVPLYSLYAQQRRADEPYASLIEGWEADRQTEQVVILTQPAIRERLDVFVPSHIPILMLPNAFADPWTDPVAWLDHEVPDDSQVIWFLYDESAGNYETLNRELLNALRTAGCQLWDTSYDTTSHAAAFLSTHPEAKHAAEGEFTGHKGLLDAYGIQRIDLPHQSAICLTLRWMEPPDSHQVRMEIQQADGTAVQGATVDLEVGAVETAFGLITPLPPGDYSVIVALVNTLSGESVPFESNSQPVALTTITVGE